MTIFIGLSFKGYTPFYVWIMNGVVTGESYERLKSLCG